MTKTKLWPSATFKIHFSNDVTRDCFDYIYEDALSWLCSNKVEAAEVYVSRKLHEVRESECTLSDIAYELLWAAIDVHEVATAIIMYQDHKCTECYSYANGKCTNTEKHGLVCNDCLEDLETA